jgi:hypothetical protein
MFVTLQKLSHLRYYPRRESLIILA